MNIRSGIKSTLLLVCCCYAVSARAADAIHGTVRNQTTGKAAADDEVILLRLQNGMEEEGRTRTDAEGAFSLGLAATKAQYIVRAIHQGVNYDQPITSAEPVQIGVFDAVAKIRTLSGKLGIVKVESDGTELKISEMYSIDNRSAPPVTQAGPRNFEFALAPEARLDSFQAKRAGGVWVNLASTPVKGQKDGFAVDFPLRPGETLFRFTYHLPYDGHATLHVKLAYPIENLAVVHPPSMTFKALRERSFTSPGLVQGMQLEQAVAKPVSGEVPAFEISGAGAAPQERVTAPAVGQDQMPATPASAVHASGPATAPRTQSQAQVWLVLGGIVAILMVGTVGWWRGRRSRYPAAPGGSRLVETLQEELYQLEVEKLRGSISDEQYDATKQALDVSLKRATARSKS